MLTFPLVRIYLRFQANGFHHLSRPWRPPVLFLAWSLAYSPDLWLLWGCICFLSPQLKHPGVGRLSSPSLSLHFLRQQYFSMLPLPSSALEFLLGEPQVICRRLFS